MFIPKKSTGNYIRLFHIFQGDEYVFYEDWGEQLVGKSCPVVCVLDVEAGIVSTLDNLPDNISPGQVTYCVTYCRHLNRVSKFC